MKRRPTPGLVLSQVTVRNIRDGDTLTVSVSGSDREWAIRLIDCWCPERYSDEGKKATAFVEETLRNVDSVMLHIPEPEHVTNLLRNLTFDRIPGWIWISEYQTLNDLIVERGFGFRTKQELIQHMG